MSPDHEKKDVIIYRLVLTGGPCSGKTTGQARLCTFFENLGWKVYRVPETASTLLGGGVLFSDLNQEEADKFQENLIKTMIAMETTFFDLAESSKSNCLVICDRGIMDASAYMSKDAWEKVLKTNGWNAVELRDNRYNQVVHLITAANGAEVFYNILDNPCRTEGLELARQLDKVTAEAWVGHPYMDIIDNDSTNFDVKLIKMIDSICRRIGIDASDRLAVHSRKIKFLVESMPPDSVFPPFQDFEVVHDYLITSNPKVQSRLRKRGQNGNWSYQYTMRRSDAGNEIVENMLAQRDDNHLTVYKSRRCFLWEDMYFHMDIYKSPCKGLVFLEMYTAVKPEDLMVKLPNFLKIIKDVTVDPSYSMYKLSSKSEISNNLKSVRSNSIGTNAYDKMNNHIDASAKNC